MRRWLISLFLLLASPAFADSLVVQTCGTLPQAYKPGATRLETIDVNGNRCSTSGSGGTVTANQGTPAVTANSWPIKVTDGTNTAAVKPSSTPAAAADPALVMTMSPNSAALAVSSAAAVSSITGSVSGATITNASTQIVAAASRRLLAIDNESTTATIACAFGATAALNTAGSFTLPPGSTRTWSSYPVPADAVNCISSAATSPATIEVN